MNPTLKELDRSFVTGNQFENHEILMRHGQWYLQCYLKNKQTYNTAYVSNRVCPDCGPLRTITNGNSSSNELQESNGLVHPAPTEPIPQEPKTTQVICTKCSEVMEQVAPDIYYCRNGHKRALVDLIDQKESKPEPAKQQTKCFFCKKSVVIEQESKIGNKRKIRYSCGHSEFVPLTILNEETEIMRDEIWEKLYPFQRAGVEFIEKAGGSALVGDEMGLGKTVQAQAFLRYNYADCTPCLMVCEASKVYDWKMEFNKWVGSKFNEIKDEPMIHTKGNWPLFPGLRNHIISMSLLSKPKVLESILSYGFKLVIIDESHSFKSDKTGRTTALQTIARKIPNRLFLSGTPIMNKVMEYFVPLNILLPKKFPNKSFIEDRCMVSRTGRLMGLKEYYRPRFFHDISEVVIRRTKKDTGIKLPKFRKFTKQVNIQSDKNFVMKYNKIAENIEKLLIDKRANVGSASTIIAQLTLLRQVIGIAKVEPTVQLVEEFLESTDADEKICIGIHHKLVMEKLAECLKEYNPICISDEDPKLKMRKLDEFRKPENRLAIISVKGVGQGHNIQFCKNAILAERQWSASTEEQFFCRFHRPEQNPDGTMKEVFDDAKDSVTIDILNVAETIDQFFDALVQLKKNVVDSTMDADNYIEESFMMELAEQVAATRLHWTA